ncbi:MAG: hypothetical protein IKC77_03240 [Lentisphaeria bacterium]|nr:hypothetical protein [Lentisphaeria bacterium]
MVKAQQRIPVPKKIRLLPTVMRFPNFAVTIPLTRRENIIKMLRTMCRMPPAAMPPSSSGKFKLFPIATTINGMAREQTEYIVKAENPA